jgi:O-antigen ligase
MTETVNTKIIGYWLISVFALTFLIVTPWTSYDPIASPKFAMLVSGAGALLFLLLYSRDLLMQKKYWPVLFISVAFALDLVIVLAFSGTNFYQELYGAYGRKAGFITQLSLLIFFISATLVASRKFLSLFTYIICGLGLVSAAYGFIQKLGWDPAPWALIYSPVFGFTGNPNFQSALLGIAATWIFASIFYKGKSLLQKFIMISCVLVLLYGIFITNSVQGFLCFAVGASAYLFFHLLYVVRIPNLIVVALASVLSLSGLFLFKLFFWDSGSILIRREYWAAAFRMLQTHPMLGVGIESYGDWYRRARSDQALIIGNGTWSNSSHNILMDYAAWGGFPLLLAYLLLVGLTMLSLIRIIKLRRTQDLIAIPLFASWFAYQAQSLITPNQIGILLLGWILSGLIIGYEISSRNLTDVPMNKKSIRNAGLKNSIKAKVAMILSAAGFVLGASIGIPQYSASANFLTALNSSDARRIVTAVIKKPIECERVFQVLRILKSNNLNQNAMELAKFSSTQCVDSYEFWLETSTIEGLSTADVTKMRAEMKRLDPLLIK